MRFLSPCATKHGSDSLVISVADAEDEGSLPDPGCMKSVMELGTCDQSRGQMLYRSDISGISEQPTLLLSIPAL